MQIESYISNVLCGSAANALTMIITHLGAPKSLHVNEQELIKKGLTEKITLSSELQKAAAGLSKSITNFDQNIEDKIKFYLVSPEVDAIVRQLYASSLLSERGCNERDIERTFLYGLSLYLKVPEEEVRSLGSTLFSLLKSSCEKTLQIAIDQGLLSAHEVTSTIRCQIILDEIRSIQKGLIHLRAPEKPDVDAILEFEGKYRDQVGQRHGFITPPHFDAARKLPISELFVRCDFIRIPLSSNKETVRLNLEGFMKYFYRGVLLGNPGAGKSTMTSKICYDLATRYNKRLVGGRQLTPVLVVLRDYGAQKKNRRMSILQYIEESANSKYQILPPPHAFEYLLDNSRIMIIFDGLDELLDTNYRQEISSDIESFCSLYPTVPVLVTSREVGYDKAPLDIKMFDLFRLTEFDEDQVEEYATKWFGVDPDLSDDQKKQKTKSFLQESEVVSDLRSNPLMLALMCNIYRGENYIPRNRPDVYEKCAIMLFERWDKSRGIMLPLPFEAHISSTMKYLAHWIYSDDTLQGGVTENKLIAKSADYLCSWRFDDRDEAEAAAKEFIEFCRGRAWVFTEIGIDPTGPGLYQFTHRTFLEYFTAAHLVRTNPTPDMLYRVLKNRIANGEWDMVAQLAFQIQNNNVEGAGDDLLCRIISEASSGHKSQRLLLLSFAARALEFLVPKPNTVRCVTLACVDWCIEFGKTQEVEDGGDISPELERGEYRKLIAALLWATFENRPAVTDAIQRDIIERINDSEDMTACLACEIGLHLNLGLYLFEERQAPKKDLNNHWLNVSEYIFDNCIDRIKQLSKMNKKICIDLVRRDIVAFEEAIDRFGIEIIFMESQYLVYFPAISLSMADTYLNFYLFRGENLKDSKKHASMEKQVITIAESLPKYLPLHIPSNYKILPHGHFGFPTRMSKSKRRKFVIEGQVLFGILLLLCIYCEYHDNGVKRITKMNIPDSLKTIVSAWRNKNDLEMAKEELIKANILELQQDLILKWITGDTDFVVEKKRGRRIPPYGTFLIVTED
jgi:hypothetical protein